MKIAMIISTPFPPEEGIGFHVYNLSKKLIEKGNKVTVITRGSLSVEKDTFEDINIIRIPFVPLYPFHVHIHEFWVNRTFKNIENRFDLVHIHTPLAPVVKTKLPIIGTIHTSVVGDAKHLEILNKDTLKWKLNVKVSSRYLIQKLIDKAECITTVSSAVKDELIEFYKNSDPLVIYNGVNENVFLPKEVKNKDPYILYVARLDYRKGVLDLIEAVKLIKKFDIKIVVAGEGPLKNHFQKEIRKNKLNNVNLIGHVSGNKLIELYQNALMFIFPSLYEGLPTVLLEAMSCALPVITTEIPAHKDLIRNMENGIFIKPRSPEELVKNILMLKEDKDLRLKLGINARKTIEKKFTFEIISKKYEKIYKTKIIN